jgi:hypothetical protein
MCLLCHLLVIVVVWLHVFAKNHGTFKKSSKFQVLIIVFGSGKIVTLGEALAFGLSFSCIQLNTV